jgi:hypothetical protein
MDPKYLAAFKVEKVGSKKSHTATILIMSGGCSRWCCCMHGPRHLGEDGGGACNAPQPERESSGRHHSKERGILGVGWECWVHGIALHLSLGECYCG